MKTKPLLLVAMACALVTGCSKKTKTHPHIVHEVEPPKITMLLDIEHMHKPVVTIEGWQDYRAGDIVSAQGGSEGTYEIVRGWFIVQPSKKVGEHRQPHFVRMYHVKERQPLPRNSPETPLAR